MKFLMIILFAFSLVPAIYAKEAVATTYRFDLPDEVDFEQNDTMEFYTFKWGDGPHRALFMLHANPAPLSSRALPAMAEMMEIAFEDQMAKQGYSDIRKNRTEISLGPFEGIQLEFVIEQTAGLSTWQYIFILHDDSKAWNGQLTTSSEADIHTAHLILKKATKSANQRIEATRDTRRGDFDE